MLYFPKLSKFPRNRKRKNCKRENHSLRKAWKGDNVCLQLGKWAEGLYVPERHYVTGYVWQYACGNV